jgi:hypothetical protein
MVHRRVLEAYKKMLGPEHPHTLASTSNLDLVFHHQGKCEEAEALHRRALRDREKVLGLEHPAKLARANKLGLVFNYQGSMKKHKHCIGVHSETVRKCLYWRTLALYHQGEYEHWRCNGRPLDHIGENLMVGISFILYFRLL